MSFQKVPVSRDETWRDFFTGQHMLGLFVFPNSHVNLQGQEHAALQRLLQKAGDELPSVCSVFKDKGYTAKNEVPVVQAF